MRKSHDRSTGARAVPGATFCSDVRTRSSRINGCGLVRWSTRRSHGPIPVLWRKADGQELRSRTCSSGATSGSGLA